jgi:hypothetical protein
LSIPQKLFEKSEPQECQILIWHRLAEPHNGL